jgi:hypothetical protein
MELSEATRKTGFSVCNFGPDGDECEVCDKPGKQLYYRRTDPFSHDGQYYCEDCVKKEAEQNAIYN